MDEPMVWLKYGGKSRRVGVEDGGKLDVKAVAKLWKLDIASVCVGPDLIKHDEDGRSIATISQIRTSAASTGAGDGLSEETAFIIQGDPAVSSQVGTDDDLPPQSGRVFRLGRTTGNGRTMSGSGHYGRSGPDQHLRKLEKEAYVAVLRAFTAQSEVITWRKEQLLVTLRQELRISDEQHLEVLKGMDSNAAPQQFRDRRLPEEEHGGSMYAANLDSAAGARKKPKISHSLQTNLAPPPLKSTFPSPPAPPPPLTSHAKRAPPGGGSRGKKSKGGRQHTNASSSKPLQFGGMPAGEGLISGINPWVGKRVKIRWPEDNAFYEAVISDWDPEKDLHALVYEMNTENETWEWVDLKELSSNDLQTIDGPLVNVTGKNPPSNFGVGGRGTTGRSAKKGAGRNNLMASYSGWGRPSSKGPSNSMERSTPGLPARNWKTSHAENGLDTKGSKQFQLPSLEALVKQVDRIAEEDDLATIESIKRAAKKRLAIRVLSQDCSSGSCERNWSTWALYHTKRRNKLSTAQLEHLVFCNCNLKLLERAAMGPESMQVNVDKIDIEKVRDIPTIPQEDRDFRKRIEICTHCSMRRPRHLFMTQEEVAGEGGQLQLVLVLRLEMSHLLAAVRRRTRAIKTRRRVQTPQGLHRTSLDS